MDIVCLIPRGTKDNTNIKFNVDIIYGLTIFIMNKNDNDLKKKIKLKLAKTQWDDMQ
jgi:hypothetical protein